MQDTAWVPALEWLYQQDKLVWLTMVALCMSFGSGCPVQPWVLRQTVPLLHRQPMQNSPLQFWCALSTPFPPPAEGWQADR